ncbi:MAG TPA: type II secretion system protein [Candidatus Saccharimonadales bacterium]
MLGLQLKRLTERGDTVVEVLVSIAVVSLLLGGAFVTADRSFKGNRDAQERQSAVKLAEGQVEQLKYLAGTSPDSIFGASVPAAFCLTGTVTASNASDAACRVNADGSPTTADPSYNLRVTRTSNDFTVLVTWEALTGTASNVTLKYRVYR